MNYVISLIICVLGAGSVNTSSLLPEQIHLSLGRSSSEIAITWTTYKPTSKSLVAFGKSPQRLERLAEGSSEVFIDGGPLRRVHHIHRVLLPALDPFVVYYYKCGNEQDGWSVVDNFRALSNRTDWSPRVIVYGDLGVVNGQSIPRLAEEVRHGQVDVVMHIGDFGYDLDTNNSYLGDDFMKMIQPIAGRLPYQTCPGNHENAYNFSNYENRFTMFDQHSGARSPGNHLHTFTLGPARFILFSSEFYYFIEYGLAQIYYQYRWLEKVLTEANRPENRARWPWLITMAHRPMYCSNSDRDDCTRQESFIRKGLPVFRSMGLEQMFHRHGVDIEFWAHEHSYERLWPVYDRRVYNGSYERPYTDPKAPVHIITGSAGCRERLDPFVPNPAEWSAVRLADYGYTRLHILNATHVHIEQVSDDQDGHIIDSVDVVQHKHAPRTWP